MKKLWNAALAVLVFALTPAVASAQGGSLSYGPATVAAIPVDNPLLIGLTALLIGAVGAWVLFRRPPAARVLGVLAALAGTAALTLYGPAALVGSAEAVPVETILDNPKGGTVPLGTGPQSFRNATSIDLRVTAISPPCPGAVNKATGACAAGTTVLASNESCGSEFVCPEPEVCDGVDNDLNGSIDDGVTPPAGGCSGTWACQSFSGWVCEACTPSCAGKACGDDGCGGSCGSCPTGFTCDGAGACIPI